MPDYELKAYVTVTADNAEQALDRAEALLGTVDIEALEEQFPFNVSVDTDGVLELAPEDTSP